VPVPLPVNRLKQATIKEWSCSLTLKVGWCTSRPLVDRNSNSNRRNTKRRWVNKKIIHNFKCY
jgi:hypothetical protein